MLGKDSKKIYVNEKIKLRFEDESAYLNFVRIVHIINPLKFLIIGIVLQTINIAIVAIFELSSYIAAILPIVCIILLTGYRKYNE